MSDISAPNLLTIQYEGKPPGDFFLSSFPSLVEADVHFYSDEEHEDPKKILVQLFEKLSRAEILKVCICAGSFPQVLSEADILLTDLPAFNNLINLVVGSSLCCTRSSFGSNSVGVMRCFFRFLPLAPNLESIVFTQSIYIPEEECWSLDPKFSLPHLKSIKVQSFMGNQMELNAIKLCLKHARFLETVTIVASPKLSKDHRKQLDVTKLLLMYPKPADCVVKFLTCSEDA